MAVLAFALLSATLPLIVVHAHEHTVAGHTHHDVDHGLAVPADPEDAATAHVHDACGVTALAAVQPAPAVFALGRGPAVGAPRIAALSAAPPDFLHRPPIA